MKKNDRKIEITKFPPALTGMFGELMLYVFLLDRGYTVEWDGGLTRGHDMRVLFAAHPNLRLQLKTTADGKIAWQKDGSDALQWAEEARASGEIPLFVFAHVPNEAGVTADLRKMEAAIKLPKHKKITAATPERFADEVDKTRTEYGKRQRTRSQDGRPVQLGETLNPNGVRYPACVDDFDDFSAMLVALST